MNEIKKLNVFNYTFKNDKNKTPRVGVIAQDLQKIFPNAVAKGDDGFLTIRMEDMFYALVNAVKELDRMISDLKRQVSINIASISKLEEKIAVQEKQINTLEKQNIELKKQCQEFEKRIKNLESK